jgi:hypothetical protein
VYSTDIVFLSFVSPSALVLGKTGKSKALLKRLCINLHSCLKLRQFYECYSEVDGNLCILPSQSLHYGSYECHLLPNV